MENVTSDSDKILSEKLALSRELSSLRPEVEHLRAQGESNQGLLSEKLALQRQLSTLQVELENEKRTAARVLAKQGKKMEQDEELRNESEELHKELTKEKKERMKVEAKNAEATKALEEVQAKFDVLQQATDRLQTKADKLAKKESKSSKRDEANDAALEALRQELEQEKILHQNASLANANQEAEIERLQEELEQERQDRQKAEKTSKKGAQQKDGSTDEARKELEEEKRERKRQDKEYAKSLAELQGRNNILDDKLSAFRDKLRTTKEKLKEKEAELERSNRAQTAPPSKAGSDATTKPAKAIRKRMATVEPETNLGTPGDGFPQKKLKRATSAIGDTSTFSLTPFLNRNTSVAPASPIVEEEEEEEVSIPQEATPTTTQPKKALKKVSALVPSSNKANTKPRKKTALPGLTMVSEEASEPPSSNASPEPASKPAPRTVPLKDAAGAGPSKPAMMPKMKSKPRKSLMSFATFAEEPAAEKKKKRKLGASAGKTLFDAEDAEDAAPVKPAASSKGLFAARALSKGGLKARPISGGFGMMSEEAFTFSPLKKDRRGASILK
jgi:hypothetical protein